MKTFNTTSLIILHLLVFMVYAFTARNSSGFHHEDEHYQIIGFAEYKLGNVAEVPWEYKKKIRSSLQPIACMGIFKVSTFFKITDPFYQTFFLRLISAVLSLCIIWFYLKATLPDFEGAFKQLHIAFSFFLWFLPYINVRFSSESWAGIFFLLAIAHLKYAISKNKFQHYYFTGIFLGLSVLFRFQSIFLIFGLLMWCVFIAKIPLKKTCLTLGTLTIVFFIGILLDHWFYGSWTISLYNYFYENFVNNVASKFGVSPWYTIIQQIIELPSVPIGILLLIAFLYTVSKDPKNILVWCIVPFLLAHTISPHKEPRFLFPIVNLLPTILTLFFQKMYLRHFPLTVVTNKIIIFILLVFNFLCLYIFSYKSTRDGQTEIADYIYHNFSKGEVNLLCTYESNPFDPALSLRERFYKNKRTEIVNITSLWDIELEKQLSQKKTNLVVLRIADITGKVTVDRLRDLNLKLVKSTLPWEMYKLVSLYDSSLFENQLLLFQSLNP